MRFPLRRRFGLLTAALVAAAALPRPSAAQPAPDPVLATVNGTPIRMSDVQAAADTLPPSARDMPPAQLVPLLVDQLIDARALLIEAQRTGLDKDPAVMRMMQAAQEHALETALLNKTVRAQISDEAVKARYDAEAAGKPAEQELHARHILVPDEATAKKIIAELKKGADFAALSKQYSKDPGAASQGGDLGFFKKTDMVPEFADAAFALKDNEVSSVPVKTQFGWHVIQALGRRAADPPPFEEEKDQLRQAMVQEAVQKEIALVLTAVRVERFNMDGSAQKPTDDAQPPPAKK